MTTFSRLVSVVRHLVLALSRIFARPVAGRGAPGARLAALACAGFLLFLAAGPAAADSCPNAQVRTGYGAQLPDCRAYEQATPVDKDGTAIAGSINRQEASSSGNALMYYGGTGVPGADGAANFTEFEAWRGPGGWSTQGVLPPESAGPIAAILGWTPDLSQVFDRATQFGAGTMLLMRSEPGGTATTMVPANPNIASIAFDGTSADGSVAFFEASGGSLAPGAVAGRDNLYVWDRATGTVSLVGVLPAAEGGGAPSGGSFAGAYDWQDGDPSRGGAQFKNRTGSAISSDGSRVYFTAGDTGQLYLRTDPASANAATVRVSASQKTNGAGAGGTDPNGPQPAAFMDATSDGAHALFTSSEELTNDATTGADQGNDLYSYDASTTKLTDLTPDPVDAKGADVLGVLGMSSDASYVYFAANGVLAANAGANGSQAQLGTCSHLENGTSGTCNLYVWHDGVITFIAQLNTDGNLDPQFSPSDALNWLPSLNGGGGGTVEATARVTPDGGTLLFSSQAQLTANPTGGWQQLYRYTAATGSLLCVSCDPSGASPTAGASEISIPAPTSGPGAWAPFLTRNLSADGNRVFFDTPDALLPQDANGVQDVYEWEANGSGSCHSTAQKGGCLYLLSTGQSADPSYLADVSASGNDVFILTTQPLVGGDQDQLSDIYDVRVDGGLASQNLPPSESCVGEACRGVMAAPLPPLSMVGTVSFAGPGDVSSPAAQPRVTVLTRVVRGASFLIRVKVPARGRVTVSGQGVRTVSRSTASAGTYSLRVSLTAEQKKALGVKRTLRLVLRVGYAPAVGVASVASVRVTVARATARTRRAPRQQARRVIRDRRGGVR